MSFYLGKGLAAIYVPISISISYATIAYAALITASISFRLFNVTGFTT